MDANTIGLAPEQLTKRKSLASSSEAELEKGAGAADGSALGRTATGEVVRAGASLLPCVRSTERGADVCSWVCLAT